MSRRDHFDDGHGNENFRRTPQEINEDADRNSRYIDSLLAAGHSISDINADEGEARVSMRVGDWIGHYHGGPYIDIAHASAPDRALDAINVHDYETGTNKPIGPDALRQHITDWADDSGEDTLRESRYW